MPSINYAYVNGRFLPEDQATVPISDRGFLHGDSVFETMRVYGGKIFRRMQHLDRMFDGLQRLNIAPILSPEELRAICRVLISRNGVTSGCARIQVSRDSIAVTARPMEFAPRDLTATISNIRVEPQLSGFKTGNRLLYILAQQQAAIEGTTEALLLNAGGQVVEFCNSNIFVVKDGELFTPPLADGPLPGIARNAVIVLAEELRLPVHETSFTSDFLDSVDETFATNSLIEIAPVATWGSNRTLTSKLQQAYRKLVKDELALLGNRA